MKKQLPTLIILLFLSHRALAWQDRTIGTPVDSVTAGSRVSTNSQEAFDRFQKRLAFIENYFLVVSSARFDTALSFKIVRNRENSPGLSTKDLSRIPAGVDLIDNQVRQRSTGNAPTFSLGALLSQGVNAAVGKSGAKRQRRLQIIPSENEVRILKTLWAEKRATGAEVYRHLDSVRVTAAGLEDILTEMTTRGLLTRRQVSPRNEFTIATPFGAIPIEMSTLNRKNRAYVYEPTMSADEIWSYLDASLFNLQSGAAVRNDGLLTQHLRQLMLIMTTPSE